MALFLVATPIGNNQDISQRALEILKKSEVIILEEFKEGSTLLKANGITGKKYEQLNEHSTAEDLKNLLALCKTKDVALITDCGTPGFCDPGADLVKLCREQKIAVTTIPGASSLMGLLSLTSRRINEFVFRGFLPANSEERIKAIKELQKEPRAIVLMDTPYRLAKIIDELAEYFSERQVLLALDLTQESEQILEGLAKDLKPQILHKKAEFMCLLYPKK